MLFDVQVMNDHLASLGCVEVRRGRFLERLLALPLQAGLFEG